MPPKRDRKIKPGKINVNIGKKNVVKKVDKNPELTKENSKQQENTEHHIIDDLLEEDLPELEPIDTYKKNDIFIPQNIKEIIILSPENRLTSDHLTLFECGEILSIRAEQIRQSNLTFIEDSDISDFIEIARRELLARKCPLKVRRAITDNIYEDIPVNDMIFSPDIANTRLD